MRSFGEALQQYRRGCRTTDDKLLTQERLAELLEQVSGVSYTAGAISEWERGKSKISEDDRLVLVGLIRVLHSCGCLKSPQEADELLAAGNYRALNEEEIEQVNPEWLAVWPAGRDLGPTPPSTLMEQRAEPGGLRARVIALAGKLTQLLRQRPDKALPVGVQLYSPHCGSEGIDLAEQRLLVTRAFGTYFAGLLERSNLYTAIEGQLQTPSSPGQALLSPIERIFWALQYPKGPHLLIVAAEGGMGKSTLAAKVVRCLFEERAIDMLLGDSAKSQRVDVITGEVREMEPGYYDISSFYERLSSQLGLPYEPGRSGDNQALVDIRSRLIGRRAALIVDNLESVTQGDALLRALDRLASRDVRAIVTTRSVSGLGEISARHMVVQLNPITDLEAVKAFLAWHIQYHQEQFTDLHNLLPDLDNRKRLQLLVDRTGGIPLLIQLVFSDVARFSWDYLLELPQLFGKALLNFLYQAAWSELAEGGGEGRLAKGALRWVSVEQYRGHRVTYKRLAHWAEKQGQDTLLPGALRLLHERFMIVNHDPKRGNFTVFPSLVEFLDTRADEV